jgi:hypothetical protein
MITIKSSVFLGLVFLSQRSKTIHAQRQDVCASDVQCLNEGRCQLVDHAENDNDVDGSNLHRHCVCQTEFGGSRCEKYCPLNCLNGGYCRFDGDMTSWHQRFDDNAQDYACKCLGYFAGTFCEIPYENCSDGRQCFHGGHCQDRVGESNKRTVCACPGGFKGPSCEVDLSVIKAGFENSSSSRDPSQGSSPVGENSSPSRDAGQSSSPTRSTGPVLAGVFVSMIVIAFAAAFVYRRRRRKHFSLVEPPDVAEFVPRGSGGHQELWKNII